MADDLNIMFEEYLKKRIAFEKEQETLPISIRQRHLSELEAMRAKIQQEYQEINEAYAKSIGEVVGTSNRSEQPSLVGCVYSGLVEIPDEAINKTFNITVSYTFLSEHECSVKSDLAPKPEFVDLIKNSGLNIPEDQLHQTNTYSYSFDGVEVKVVDDTGRILVEDGGKTLNLIDDTGTHGKIALTKGTPVISASLPGSTEQPHTNNAEVVANFTKLLKQHGTLTYILKGTGTKKNGKRTDGLKGLQIALGDFYYDCKLVLKSDYTGVFTFSAAPSEQAKACQTVHLKRNGQNQRHHEYVQAFFDTAFSGKNKVEGKWSIVDGEIHFEDRSQYHDFIIINNDTMIWDFMEPCQINRAK